MIYLQGTIYPGSPYMSGAVIEMELMTNEHWIVYLLVARKWNVTITHFLIEMVFVSTLFCVPVTGPGVSQISEP
jgi:hypothetical protein